MKKGRKENMKNFSSKKSRTLIKEMGDQTPFIKIKDLFGDKTQFKKGEVQVLGFIKVKSDMYDKVQYSLAITYKDTDYFLNVPSWYGANLDEDFQNSEQTAAEYFKDAFIKEIEEFPTKFKNNSYNIIVFED